VSIVIIPSRHLETPAYEIQRIRSTGGEEDTERRTSYQWGRSPEAESPRSSRESVAGATSHEPVVKEFLPGQPPVAAQTVVARPGSSGLIQRFWTLLTGNQTEDEDGSVLPPPAVPPIPSLPAPSPTKSRPSPTSLPTGSRFISTRSASPAPSQPVPPIQEPVEDESEVDAAMTGEAEGGERKSRERDGSRRSSRRSRRTRRGDSGLGRSIESQAETPTVEPDSADLMDNRLDEPETVAAQETVAAVVPTVPSRHADRPQQRERAEKTARVFEFDGYPAIDEVLQTIESDQPGKTAETNPAEGGDVRRHQKSVRERRFIAREEDDIPGNIKAMEPLSVAISDEREGWTPLTPEEIAASDSMDGLQDQPPPRVSRFATGQTGSFPAETAPTGENREASPRAASEAPTDLPPLLQWLNADRSGAGAATDQQTSVPPGKVDHDPVETVAMSYDLKLPVEVDAIPVQVAAINDAPASLPAETEASPVETPASLDAPASLPADDAVPPAEGSHNPTDPIMANGEWRMANGE